MIFDDDHYVDGQFIKANTEWCFEQPEPFRFLSSRRWHAGADEEEKWQNIFI
ncbi:MAG: hypothetical protein LUD51_00595 [Clostridia bacterium]|nr:hypothetical protein [Clostridia bacterium]